MIVVVRTAFRLQHQIEMVSVAVPSRVVEKAEAHTFILRHVA